MSFVDFFPTELTEIVFSYLSVPDLVNSSMVCVSWYEASNISNIWKAAIERSIPKDRFKIVSNLDRYTGIASNYDENYRFQVDRQSPSNLSPMNPWKLSLYQDNFVRSNWYGSNKDGLAIHRIEIKDEMMDIEVVYPSKSPQDRLHHPMIVRKCGQPEMDFVLIRLDGTPRIGKKLFSTISKIPIVCIDRECVVWVQDRQVKYLSLVEDNSQIDNVGILFPESIHIARITKKSWYMMTMNDKYIVAGFWGTFVKIWSKKTKQLMFTHETNLNCFITACHLHNERIYFKNVNETSLSYLRRSLEVYDIKKGKFIENTFYGFNLYDVINDKYHAILSGSGEFCEIRVRDIETYDVKIVVRVNMNGQSSAFKVWIVYDKVLYIEQSRLKILSLVDWNISNGMHVPSPKCPYAIYDVWDSFLLQKDGFTVKIWDWKQGTEIHMLMFHIPRVIFTPRVSEYFYIDETRLMVPGLRPVNYIEIVGFW